MKKSLKSDRFYKTKLDVEDEENVKNFFKI